MATYDKKGQIDLYQKRKTNWGAWVFWGFVALMVFGALAG